MGKLNIGQVVIMSLMTPERGVRVKPLLRLVNTQLRRLICGSRSF